MVTASLSNYEWEVVGNELVVREKSDANGNAVANGFAAGFDYQITPTASLQSAGVAANPPVLQEVYDLRVNPGNGGGGGGCTSCICNLALCEFAGATIGPGPDFDMDGYVGEFDLKVMMLAQGVPGGKADLNRDGIVDALDLDALLKVYGAVVKT